MAVKTLLTRAELDKKKEKNTPEVSVQEQLKSIYPTNIKIEIPIESINEKYNMINTSFNGIELRLKIDSNMYSTKDVIAGVKEACQRLLECFH